MPPKRTLTSATCFLTHGTDFLLLKRKKTKSVDPNKTNGVGGKLEASEDYIQAAIRETQEETGYRVKSQDITFCGLIKFIEGLQDNWIAAFLKIRVPTKTIPLGSDTPDGHLFWLHQDQVLKRDDLVDDLYHIFPDIIKNTHHFFVTAKLHPQTLKITHHNLTRIPIRKK